ncbi:ATP-binding protein [Streptacidiphilus sp. PB12-B1b]|uniref:ATP-binding protein n=1 Tax=Streptacidiphilus sp. PB12-B1b TaxID=2705012 RepID=UPI0015FE1C10|nr:ATP-binding protein [Streptacidiphilus sp. PB12-B1b]QMU75145.1 ATP-binding protein [Streptacidiphilus sp. PB12-B1b]
MLSQGTVRVEVSDACSAVPVVRGADEPEVADGGRGLVLVEALAQAWGVELLTHGIGKTVWFELVDR